MVIKSTLHGRPWICLLCGRLCWMVASFQNVILLFLYDTICMTLLCISMLEKKNNKRYIKKFLCDSTVRSFIFRDYTGLTGPKADKCIHVYKRMYLSFLFTLRFYLHGIHYTLLFCKVIISLLSNGDNSFTQYLDFINDFNDRMPDYMKQKWSYHIAASTVSKIHKIVASGFGSFVASDCHIS